MAIYNVSCIDLRCLSPLQLSIATLMHHYLPLNSRNQMFKSNYILDIQIVDPFKVYISLHCNCLHTFIAMQPITYVYSYAIYFKCHLLPGIRKPNHIYKRFSAFFSCSIRAPNPHRIADAAAAGDGGRWRSRRGSCHRGGGCLSCGQVHGVE